MYCWDKPVGVIGPSFEVDIDHILYNTISKKFWFWWIFKWRREMISKISKMIKDALRGNPILWYEKKPEKIHILCVFSIILLIRFCNVLIDGVTRDSRTPVLFGGASL